MKLITLVVVLLLSKVAAGQPNIILILTDDQNLSDVDSMPNVLSLISEQGTAFSNYFVNVSLCCPSRASILLGQNAHNHQVYSNLPPDGGFERFYELGHENSTLATWLQAAGYHTALFGKYLNGYPGDLDTHVPPGWTEWYGVIGSYFDYRINENGKIISYGSDSLDYETDVLSRKVTDFIRRAPTPFFVYLAPAAPHKPSTPAPRHANRFASAVAPQPVSYDEADVSDKPAWIRAMLPLTNGEKNRINDRYRNRLRTLLAVDEMVKSLIDTLIATKQLDNTYIFFTSDNGFEQGEHRIKQGKQTPYEEAIHVPLFIRGPGVPVRVKDQLAVNIDLAPTILELAGTVAPSALDGHSLLPLLGNRNPASWRVALIIEHWANPDTLSDRAIPEYQLLRTQNQVYIEYPTTGEREFYNLWADPYQVENIAGSAPPGVLSKMAARLAGLRICVGADCFQNVVAEDGVMVAHIPTTEVPKNYPNPFNPVTVIRFSLPSKAHTTIRVYNVIGQEVAELADGELDEGIHTVLLNGDNLPSGEYLCRIMTPSMTQNLKVTLIK